MITEKNTHELFKQKSDHLRRKLGSEGRRRRRPTSSLRNYGGHALKNSKVSFQYPYMATPTMFSSLRRRTSPSLEAFLAPNQVNESTILQTLTIISKELVLSFSDICVPCHMKNFQSLIRKIDIFVSVFEHFKGLGSGNFFFTAILCFKEMYITLSRTKMLLDYCSQSSRLWLLLQNSAISNHFLDLNKDILTFIEVLPFEEIELCEDVKELIELLKKQLRREKLFIDQHDEAMRVQLFNFLHEFEVGGVPDKVELQMFFVEGLGIRDEKSCRSETEFLEDLICNYENDIEPSSSVVKGVVALTRYCRFLIFGFSGDEETMCLENWKKERTSQQTTETLGTVPKDFCCPISLDLMRDPVIVSTGHTYDRDSITQWMEEGNYSCPQTGQMLAHTRLVPNIALRSLISEWCITHGIYYPIETEDKIMGTISVASPTKAVIEVNRAAAKILVEQLSCGSDGAKIIAAHELRLLAKTRKESRACIAQLGAIPLLQRLLSNPNLAAQENAVTAILNLSLYEDNKSLIVEEPGCLSLIVEVLRFGHTEESRENAAATLFSLSAVHDYKKRITDETGAISALAGLLKEGTQRGKKDAVTALFNLSTHVDNCSRMIEAGAITVLVDALETEGVAEEASGVLGMLVRQPIGVQAINKEERAVPRLIKMMRHGTSRGKENAVSAMLELCRNGGPSIIQKVSKVPAFSSFLHILLYTGTKRARRKAASLAKVCQKYEAVALPYGLWGVGYTFSSNSAANVGSDFASDVSMSVSISVPVL